MYTGKLFSLVFLGYLILCGVCNLNWWFWWSLLAERLCFKKSNKVIFASCMSSLKMEDSRGKENGFFRPNPWRCCMWKHNTLVRSLHSLCWHWAACAAPLGYGNAGRSHLLHVYFWMRCGGIISWNDLCFTVLVFKGALYSHTKSSKSRLIKLAGYFKLWVQMWALESASIGVGVSEWSSENPNQMMWGDYLVWKSCMYF